MDFKFRCCPKPQPCLGGALKCRLPTGFALHVCRQCLSPLWFLLMFFTDLYQPAICIYLPHFLFFTCILQEKILSVFQNRNSCSGNKSKKPASKLLLLRQADFHSLQNCKCGFQTYLLDSFSNVHCSCTTYLQYLFHRTDTYLHL